MEILVSEFEAPWHKQPSLPISPTPLGKLFTVFSGVERNIPASANIRSRLPIALATLLPKARYL